MKPRTSSDFKFHLDEDRPDSIFQEEMENLRLEKLNRRINFISIFIPILMVLILVYGYLEIKKKFVKADDSGAQKVQVLATELESKFSSLSLKYAKLEESLNKSFSPINEIFLEFEKTATALKKDLEKNERSLASLETEKATKKELSDLAAMIDSRIAPLAADIQQNSTARRIEIEKLGYSIADIAARVEKNGNSIQNFAEDITTLSSMSSAMTNNKMVILGLKTDLQSYRETLAQTIKQIEDTLLSVREKLDAIQQATPPATPSLQPVPDKSQSAADTADTSTPENAPGKAAAPPPPLPEPGAIVEQDIE